MEPLDHSRLNIAVTSLIEAPHRYNQLLDIVSSEDNAAELTAVLEALRNAFRAELGVNPNRFTSREDASLTVEKVSKNLLNSYSSNEETDISALRAGRALAWALEQRELEAQRKIRAEKMGLWI